MLFLLSPAKTLDYANPALVPPAMRTPLANPRGKDLYAFWGSTITRHLTSAWRGIPCP